MANKTIVFSGNANKKLAESACRLLGLNLGKLNSEKFSDGETKIEILEDVAGKEIFIIQPTCPPVNDNLMELLLIIDAVKRAAAAGITAVIPYFGYSRQDRITGSLSPISAKLAADLIAAAGTDRVVTLDLHSDQIQGFFNLPVDNLSAGPAFMKYLEKIENLVIVSPDAGGVKRARAYAKELKTELAVIDKRRDLNDKIVSMRLIGEVAGKNALIVDDLIDTGNTLIEAVRTLKQSGANEVFACSTHAVLSGQAVELLKQSELTELIVSDSIPLGERAKDCPKFKIVSVAEILAMAIKK